MSAMFSGFAGLGITLPVRPPIPPVRTADGAHGDSRQSELDRQPSDVKRQPAVSASPPQPNEKRN